MDFKLKVLRFLIIFTFFQMLVYYISHNFDLVFLKWITAKGLSLLGFGTYGNVIYLPKLNASLKLENYCTGILMYFTLISLFFIFFDLKTAIMYSIFSIPIVYFLNLIRIISSISVGIITNNFELLMFVHDFIWFFAMPILIYLVFKEFEKLNKKHRKNQS